MTTYTYECQENGCKAVYFENQSMKDKAFTKCKFCDGKVKRVITGGSGFILKGSGFYKTDNRG